MDEARLLCPRNHANPYAGLPFHLRDEIAAVVSFASGRGRRSHNLVNFVRNRETLELGKCLQGSPDGRGRETASVKTSRAQTNHFLFPINDFEGQVWADLHDDHVDGVRSNVDGGNTHEGGSRNGPAGGVLACYTCDIYWPSVEPAAILP